MPMSAIRCPSCGHQLLAIDLPTPAAPPIGDEQGPPAPGPLLLRIGEAARLLGLSRSTMYQLVGKGEVPVIRIGRSVRVPRSELAKLVERS